jgi:hypothetical protein
MADDGEHIDLVEANDPERGVVRFLQAMSEADQSCAGCGKVILAGQHYLRVAVLFDTAGMESMRIIDVPSVVWSCIADDPLCAADALRAAAETELFADVFRR